MSVIKSIRNLFDNNIKESRKRNHNAINNLITFKENSRTRNVSIYRVTNDLTEFNYLNYYSACNVTTCQIRNNEVRYGKVRTRRENLWKTYRKDIPRHLYGIAQLAVWIRLSSSGSQQMRATLNQNASLKCCASSQLNVAFP